MSSFRAQLVDVIAAAQTPQSHEAITEVVKFHLPGDSELAERYLTTVSLSTRPSEYLLQGNSIKSFVFQISPKLHSMKHKFENYAKLLIRNFLLDLLRLLKDRIKDEKVKETASLSLASITNTFCADSKNLVKPVSSIHMIYHFSGSSELFKLLFYVI